jgi:hypothetical protein
VREGCKLNREALTAFGATRVEHVAAAHRFHTGTKAVRAFATDNGRLESTFHRGSLLTAISIAPTKIAKYGSAGNL